MNDNANTEVTMYIFELVTSIKGLAPSVLSREETLEKLHAEMTDFYGEGGYEIKDFREATDDEIAVFKSIAEDYLDEDEAPAVLN